MSNDFDVVFARQTLGELPVEVRDFCAAMRKVDTDGVPLTQIVLSDARRTNVKIVVFHVARLVGTLTDDEVVNFPYREDPRPHTKEDYGYNRDDFFGNHTVGQQTLRRVILTATLNRLEEFSREMIAAV